MFIFIRVLLSHTFSVFFFFNETATTEIYTLSLHDALPIWRICHRFGSDFIPGNISKSMLCGNLHVITTYPKEHRFRSEEHTSELQSHSDLVCRLLLEKKKKKIDTTNAMNTIS